MSISIYLHGSRFLHIFQIKDMSTAAIDGLLGDKQRERNLSVSFTLGCIVELMVFSEQFSGHKEGPCLHSKSMQVCELH